MHLDQERKCAAACKICGALVVYKVQRAAELHAPGSHARAGGADHGLKDILAQHAVGGAQLEHHVLVLGEHLGAEELEAAAGEVDVEHWVLSVQLGQGALQQPG